MSRGPSIGFLSGDAEVEFSDGEKRDLDDYVTSTDISILLGVGAERPVGNNTAFVVLRYVAGLSDVAEDDDVEAKTKGVQVMVGFKFRLGGS